VAQLAEHAPPNSAVPSVQPAPTPSPVEPAPVAESNPKNDALDRPSLTKTTTSEVGSTLAAEQRLLDAARAALTRGEPQSGLRPLQFHASRFPAGQLVEEREALYVRILVALERDEEAQARAANFRRRFPDSLFATVVDNALSTISRRTADPEPKP
jgi:hypothetical protein